MIIRPDASRRRPAEQISTSLPRLLRGDCCECSRPPYRGCGEAFNSTGPSIGIGSALDRAGVACLLPKGRRRGCRSTPGGSGSPRNIQSQVTPKLQERRSIRALGLIAPPPGHGWAHESHPQSARDPRCTRDVRSSLSKAGPAAAGLLFNRRNYAVGADRARLPTCSRARRFTCERMRIAKPRRIPRPKRRGGKG